jgi:hypothetical protein
MARTLSLIVVVIGGASLTGCAPTTLLVTRHEGSRTPAASTTAGSSPTTSTPTTAKPGPQARAYLAALSREQARLAAAERRIPRRARTPAALARSIGLLRLAIVRLGNDLQKIAPPSPVAAKHARLVAIVQAYAARLALAQHVALTRGGELQAIRMLVDATTAASASFGSTVRQIDAALSH